jgi:serine/threonine-protein kinase RsbW
VHRVKVAEQPAEDVRFCLVLPREALSVPVMRRVLGDTLTRLGLDDNTVADLLLAVTEACTNVLRHSGPAPRYEVVATVADSRCLLDVLDSGRGFEPSRLRVRRPAVRPPARLHRWAASPAAVIGTRQWAIRRRLERLRRGAQDAAIAQLPESGRGLAIMKACVDDVTLSSSRHRGTVVSLEKRIAWRSDAPLAREGTAQLRDAG